MKNGLIIRLAAKDDADAVWKILQPIIAKGDAFVYDPDSDKDDVLNSWMNENNFNYVALIDNEIVGSYFIKANQRDLGSHIANAGYAVSVEHSGKGIGKFMGDHSLEEAKRLGFTGMQFNFVVKSNASAVKLWQSIGFEIIGEIPSAFRHKKNGLTNAYIMYREL
jgi:ribosomal protein S18 acetylase RimI-like enzyme